ncbi:MAG: sigma-54-dependent Fis family transcriptional regulator [Candidatus Abyssobacteria bacterium SURF_17]|uniref:Sigma-54-dependent Fis family transcriptional regulator n=1 Tax=Candidatus Abyssobacteria bacterium SURF_17 TaxID=2093361 RepID=A0A419EZH8_9BACT|nr:MAG: sigma-54-dependent Fis family transcriptional regulator [Candidatus Abyssubacteria bacterium SURF_17]
MPGTILVVDDEAKMRRVLQMLFEEDGYAVAQAENGEEALQQVTSVRPDLAICDMRMPRIDGIEFLRRVKDSSPELPVIIMTAYAEVKTAVEAIKLGAENYVTKPLDMEELRILAARAIEKRSLIKENLQLRAELDSRFDINEFVGESENIQRVFRLIEQVAPTNTTVLVTGESGTGKELVARAIHFKSPRRAKPFVVVNCAALSEHLLESELFGHVKGAFTGAHSDRRGRFELADGGTLFLDELALMSIPLQGKLLRVLQEKEFEPVGSTRTTKVDVRIIGATNKHLERMLEERAFREDLYYRLNVVEIHLPPLRERKEDIPLLIKHCIAQLNRELSKSVSGISDDALALLMEYDWPGNVRELENLVERAMVLGKCDSLGIDNFPSQVTRLREQVGSQRGLLDGLVLPEDGISLVEMVEEIEKKLIKEALEKTGGNKTRAAELLKVTRKMMRYKAEKYGLASYKDETDNDHND